MALFPVSAVLMATGFGLILIGLAAIVLHRNILRMIIGFSLMDSGIAIVLVSIGYVTGGTAPIIDADLKAAGPGATLVDPIPSALAVTAIVIGLSVTAVMLSYAIRLYRTHGTLDINAFGASRG